MKHECSLSGVDSAWLYLAEECAKGDLSLGNSLPEVARHCKIVQVLGIKEEKGNND